MTQPAISLEDLAEHPELINALPTMGGEVDGEEKPYTKVVIADPATPPDVTFTLPRGYIDGRGQVHRDVVVRELTGEDEEYIAKATASGNLGKIIGAYLLRGTESIGSEPATEETLRALAIGDRDALLLAIRRVTFGDVIKFDPYICPFEDCQDEATVDYDLGVVPMRETDPEEVFNFKVTLRDGRSAVCTLPTGYDQEEIYSLDTKKQSAPERIATQNTALLARCIVSIDGERFNPEYARRLGMADRKMILRSLDEKQPGPDYTDVKVKCEACEREAPMLLSVGDLFRG